MAYTAEILSVGTELLLGNVANTDAKDISEGLSMLGINVFFHTVVGDNPERLKSAVQIARSRADIIITTGGLGPTYDDLTKQTLAESFGLKMVYNEEEAEGLLTYFREKLHNPNPTPNNMQQVWLPEGCTVFHNNWGTAPGCAFEADGIHVLMLPGPPSECNAMFKNCAMPYLEKLSDSKILSHNIHIFGLGESTVEDRLRQRMEELSNPSLAPYAKEVEVMLRLTAKAHTDEEAEALMSPVLKEVQDILGTYIYGIDTGSLENTVLQLLQNSGKTLATAESCTGGFLSKRLTDIPGASANYIGSVIAYSNSVKASLLSVPEKLLREKGAVCAEVAQLMAQNVRTLLGADFGIGITGIAGPASDGTDKPVGTVFVALADKDGCVIRSLQSGRDRNRIRITSCNHALDMLRRRLSGISMEMEQF